MSGVRVSVHPTKKGRSHVFPAILQQEGAATRMLFNEIGHIVYEARNKDDSP
jgi:hypothetical protein